MQDTLDLGLKDGKKLKVFSPEEHPADRRGRRYWRFELLEEQGGVDEHFSDVNTLSLLTAAWVLEDRFYAVWISSSLVPEVMPRVEQWIKKIRLQIATADKGD